MAPSQVSESDGKVALAFGRSSLELKQDSALDVHGDSAPLLVHRHASDKGHAQGAGAAPAGLSLHEDDARSYAHECIKLVQLAAPLAASHLLSFGLSLIGLGFAGRLGEHQLSVAVLASSIFNVTGLSPLMGFAGGMETLCGQAHGARQHAAVGAALQRALLLTALCALLIGLGWAHADALLMLLGQQPALAADAARFLLLSFPALLCAALFECIKRYLMAQGSVLPATAASCAATALAPALNWGLAIGAGLGLDGIALANSAAQAAALAVIAVLAARREAGLRGTPQQTWFGCSRDALHGWLPFMALALPATAMVCAEWWVFEICTLMSGWLTPADLQVAVMGLALNVGGLLYMVPMGLSSACSARVGNALGAGRPAAARRAARVAAMLGGTLQALLALAVLASRHSLGRIFTDDAVVIAAAARVFPVVAVSTLGDGLNATLGGMLRGAGRQALGAGVTLATYWGLGLPLAALLAFKAGLGVVGLWAGLASCTALQGGVMLAIMLRFDWQREAARSAELLARTDAQTTDPVERALGLAELPAVLLPRRDTAGSEAVHLHA